MAVTGKRELRWVPAQEESVLVMFTTAQKAQWPPHKYWGFSALQLQRCARLDGQRCVRLDGQRCARLDGQAVTALLLKAALGGQQLCWLEGEAPWD